jgi:uncharacterized membrane protein (UPF0127 family)
VPTLVCDGVDRGPAEVARGRAGKARGLLGRNGLDGGLLLPGVRGVHTLGMRFTIDVAFLDGDGTVIDTVRLRPWRLARTRWRARSVVEAEAGSFERWDVRIGSTVRVEDA